MARKFAVGDRVIYNESDYGLRATVVTVAKTGDFMSVKIDGRTISSVVNAYHWDRMDVVTRLADVVERP